MNQYLVEKRIYDESYFKIMSANEIFNLMDMEDCYYLEIYLYLLVHGMPPVPCKFRGIWDGSDDPLKMVIESATGEIIDVGYGTDH